MLDCSSQSEISSVKFRLSLLDDVDPFSETFEVFENFIGLSGHFPGDLLALVLEFIIRKQVFRLQPLALYMQFGCHLLLESKLFHLG